MPKYEAKVRPHPSSLCEGEVVFAVMREPELDNRIRVLLFSPLYSGRDTSTVVSIDEAERLADRRTRSNDTRTPLKENDSFEIILYNVNKRRYRLPLTVGRVVYAFGGSAGAAKDVVYCNYESLEKKFNVAGVEFVDDPPPRRVDEKSAVELTARDNGCY